MTLLVLPELWNISFLFILLLFGSKVCRPCRVIVCGCTLCLLQISSFQCFISVFIFCNISSCIFNDFIMIFLVLSTAVTAKKIMGFDAKDIEVC